MTDQEFRDYVDSFADGDEVIETDGCMRGTYGRVCTTERGRAIKWRLAGTTMTTSFTGGAKRPPSWPKRIYIDCLTTRRHCQKLAVFLAFFLVAYAYLKMFNHLDLTLLSSIWLAGIFTFSGIERLVKKVVVFT